MCVSFLTKKRESNKKTVHGLLCNRCGSGDEVFGLLGGSQTKPKLSTEFSNLQITTEDSSCRYKL